MRNSLSLLLLCGIALSISIGCGGGASEGPIVGNAERGKSLYNQATIGKRSAEGCTSCHKYDASEGDEKKAPFTKGTAARAESRVAGMSAEEYVVESIMNPDAYVVENYKAGDMYAKWKEDLSEQEIKDLVAYVLTEK
jgi:cytochrome c553